MYLHGLYLPQDFNKAYLFLKKSAELDFRDAQVALGLMLTDGDIPVDIDKSLYWLLRGAKNGHIVGKYNYAVFVISKEVSGDNKLAFEYMLEAERWDYKKVNYYLSLCYFYGVGVEKSNRLALFHLKKGAENEDVASLYILGQAYYLGELVDQNIEKGVALIKRAALLNDQNVIIFLKEHNLNI